MSLIGGAVLPSFAIVLGRVITVYDKQATTEERETEIAELVKWEVAFVFILWFFGYFQYAFLQHMAERLSFDLRTKYLLSLMRQEPEYFENLQVEAIPSEISASFQQLSDGVGEKVS